MGGNITKKKTASINRAVFVFLRHSCSISSLCYGLSLCREKNYEIAAGIAMFDSTGTRLPWETITIYDEKTNGKLKISAFTKRINEGDYLEIKYLPHTKFGIVVEWIDGKDYKKYSEDGQRN